MKTKNKLQVQNGLVVPVDTFVIKKIIEILSRKVFQGCDEKFCTDYLQNIIHEYALNADIYQGIRERFWGLYGKRRQLARGFPEYKNIKLFSKHIFLGSPLGVSYKFLELVEQRCFNGKGYCIWFTRDNPISQSFDHPLRMALYEFQAYVVDFSCHGSWSFDTDLLASFRQSSPLTIVQIPTKSDLYFLEVLSKAMCSGYSTILYELSERHISDKDNRTKFLDLLVDLAKSGKEMFFGTSALAMDEDHQGFQSELEGLPKN